MKQTQKAVCTIALITVNIGIFFIFMLLGKENNSLFLLEHGAMYEPYVVEGHEYYRLITSMFLHFGIDHLLNNMVMLGALGWTLELELGKVRFLILYFFSGIGANIFSMLANQFWGNEVISAGASGAIFGLMGALVCVVLRNRGRVERLGRRGVIVMVGLSLYFGITSTGVDNVAHISGLICGFAAEAILEALWKK